MIEGIVDFSFCAKIWPTTCSMFAALWQRYYFLPLYNRISAAFALCDAEHAIRNTYWLHFQNVCEARLLVCT